MVLSMYSVLEPYPSDLFFGPMAYTPENFKKWRSERHNVPGFPR